MPETATRLPSHNHAQEKGGFLFVSVTGEHAQPEDRKGRKVIRTHVMRNYLEQHNDTSIGPKKPLTGVVDSTQGPSQGQKFRFRLKPDRLEQSLPIRNRKAKAVTGSKDGGTRKRKTTKKGSSEPAEEDGFVHSFVSNSTVARGQQSRLDAKVQYSSSEPSEPDTQDVLPLGWDAETSKLFPELLEVTNPFDAYDPFLGLDEEPVLPTSPLRWFGNARVDTFGVLPFQLSPFDETLLDRFQSYVPESWCPVSGQSAWFPFAMNDVLLFHATMYNWAMHFNDMVERFLEDNPGVMQHKFIAIHMINERLSDPVAAVRDENLAAVAAVVNVEIAYGSAEASAKHMAGLQAMVQLRGGIEMLGDGIGGLLQRLVGWTDLNYAELFREPLKFTKENCEWDRVRAGEAIAAAEPCTGTCFRSIDPAAPTALPGDPSTKHSQVIPLLREIRQLCDEVVQRPLLTMSESQQMQRSDRFHALERRLRIVAEPSAEDSPGSGKAKDDLVWRSCASAGLLYVHHVLRALPLAYRQFDTLCQDLLLTLVDIEDMDSAWRFAPELLIWVLSVGTLLTSRRPQREWFAETLAGACAACGYTTWSKYRDVLRSFLWLEKLDDDRYLAVWRSIEVQIEMEGTALGSFTAMLGDSGL